MKEVFEEEDQGRVTNSSLATQTDFSILSETKFCHRSRLFSLATDWRWWRKSTRAPTSGAW